jgi:SAM-dependent methyltransferase
LTAITEPPVADDVRLRAFWNERYQQFALSESGWLGAGDRLNDRIYACKVQALRRALARLGLAGDRRWSVLDAGCGQGYFARFYRREFPGSSYVGLDLSERAVAYLQQTMADTEFHVGNLCDWTDAAGRSFDVIQSFEVLHLILDDARIVDALGNLSRQLSPGGALVMTAALPDEMVQPAGYLKHRSRQFWQDAFRTGGLRIVADRPMYYWLPAGGPSGKYLRHALNRMGADVMYALDRAAFHMRLPQPSSIGIDCRTRLLTVQRTP